MTDRTTSPDRDWWVVLGMTTAAASAAVASFSGLRGLAQTAGWPPRLAWLLPITIDAYAMTSARVWLATTTRSGSARRFARANALGAIAASTAGNAAYHAIGAGLLAVTWPIVVLVGAVPATVLGLTAHLHALRGRTAPARPAEADPESRPENPTENRTEADAGSPHRRRTGASRPRRPRHRTEADLLAAARAADTRHRAEHGRPITRDALRTALRVSGSRATELRRQLAAETGEPAGATPDTPAE
jgi:Protein of unknown function (DUF2637)